MQKIKKLFKSERGGIDAPLYQVIAVVLVLGLVGYAIFSLVTSGKDQGDKAKMEQQKVTRLMQDASTVTGSEVKDYYNKRTQLNITVNIYDTDGSTALAIANVVDGALFKTAKTYNANGDLSTISFTRVNLAQ